MQYNYFFKERSAKLKEQQDKNQVFNYGTIGSQMGELWRKLSEAAKAPYLAKARQDSQRYANEKTILVEKWNKEKKRNGNKTSPTNVPVSVSAPASDIKFCGEPIFPSAAGDPKAQTAAVSKKKVHRKVQGKNEKGRVAETSLETDQVKKVRKRGNKGDKMHTSDDGTSSTSTSINKDSFSVLSDVAFAMEQSSINSGRKTSSTTLPSGAGSANDNVSLSSFGSVLPGKTSKIWISKGRCIMCVRVRAFQ